MRVPLALVFTLLAAVTGEDCVFDRENDFSANPPVIIDVQSWTSVLPVSENSRNVIRITEGSAVLITCPQTTILATTTEVEEATCYGGNTIRVSGQDYTMQQLGCLEKVQESVFRFDYCHNGNHLHKIGFEIPNHGFYELIRICFDHQLQTSLWTYHKIRGKSVSARDISSSSSFSSYCGFFSVSANSCYKIKNQKALMKEYLGNSSIIDVKSSYYFARGHMAANADFNAAPESLATYYFINVDPQWQSINNGNWKELEASVRDLAKSHSVDLDVYTGTLNVLKLEDANNNFIEIYLGLTYDKRVIPAPEFLWKVVHDPTTNKAVAIVMSNNPYLTEVLVPFCNNICYKISWIKFNLDDIRQGAAFCCTVQELKEVVSYAPDLASAAVLES